MSGRVVLAALAGGGVGTGILLLVASLFPLVEETASARWRWPASVDWRLLAAGVLTAAAVLALTRWVAVAVALGAVVGCWPRLFGGGAEARTAISRLEALAAWTESLRDMTATGIALPEALPASVPAAAPVIRPQLQALAERLAGREPLADALHALADECDDASADLVVAALLLNARAQGRALQAVLSSLARSTRAELTARRAIEAERRSTRRGVQIVLAVTVFTGLGLAVLSPDYVAPYRSAAGQLVLTVVVAIFIGGFAWLRALATIPGPGRLLAPSSRPDGGRR